jgi:2-keto-4-pentenoate hydratase
VNSTAINQAAEILWSSWLGNRRIEALPEHCRPSDRAEAYFIQAAIGEKSGAALFGWKIAATSPAGQRHIGVDGPLAGRLLSSRVLDSGSTIALGANCMRVAEAEFAFRMARTLAPRSSSYSIAEVMDAVEALHPAIEIPDSRYVDFVTAGAAQLIADNACACWFVLGPEAPDSWRDLDLSAHRVTLRRNGELACEGGGVNVLGDPRVALHWIANELARHGESLRKGHVVTTGTCIVPASISAGDMLTADFGPIGQVGARIV